LELQSPRAGHFYYIILGLGLQVNFENLGNKNSSIDKIVASGIMGNGSEEKKCGQEDE